MQYTHRSVVALPSRPRAPALRQRVVDGGVVPAAASRQRAVRGADAARVRRQGGARDARRVCAPEAAHVRIGHSRAQRDAGAPRSGGGGGACLRPVAPIGGAAHRPWRLVPMACEGGGRAASAARAVCNGGRAHGGGRGGRAPRLRADGGRGCRRIARGKLRARDGERRAAGRLCGVRTASHHPHQSAARGERLPRADGGQRPGQCAALPRVAGGDRGDCTLARSRLWHPMAWRVGRSLPLLSHRARAEAVHAGLVHVRAAQPRQLRARGGPGDARGG